MPYKKRKLEITMVLEKKRILSTIFLLIIIICSLSTISASIKLYEYNSTYENVSIWAFMSDDIDDNPPPNYNNPPSGFTLTDITFDADLDARDNNRVGNTIFSLTESFMLFNVSLSEKPSDIHSINWSWEGSSPKNMYIYLWNYSNSQWYQCTNTFTSNPDINKSCYTDNQDFFSGNVTTFMIYGSGGLSTYWTDYVSLEINYTPSVTVTLNSPSNNYKVSSLTQTFNCSFETYDYQLEKAILYLWNSDGSLNTTNSTTITGNNNETIFYQTFASDNNFTWNCWGNNSNGISGFASSNRTLNIGINAPNCTNCNPADSSTLTSNSVNFSFIPNDLNGIDTCRLYGNWSDWHVNYTWYDSITGLFESILRSLTDGIYQYSIWCNDTIGNSGYGCENYTFTVDTTSPSITIVSPLDQTYITVAQLFNITLNEEGDWCGMSLDGADNISMTKAATTNFNYTNTSMVEGSHSVVFCCNDTVGNMGCTSEQYFATDLNPPSITLEKPLRNSYLAYLNNINFNYTPISDTLDTCEFWGNWSGGWHKNQSDSTPVNATTNQFILNLTEGHYFWNIMCNESGGNHDWSLQGNFTFTLDITNPLVDIDAITTTVGSKTFSLEDNITDINLNTSACTYTIKDSLDTVVGTANTSYTCNSLTAIALANYGTYTLKITGIDLAGNLNTSSQSFTLSASSGGDTGGGGGSVSVCGDGVCGVGESYENCPDDCSQPILTGVCGNGICEEGETFWDCAEDCGGLNLDSYIIGCFSDDPEEKNLCIINQSPTLFWIVLIIIIIVILAIISETKKGKKYTKNIYKIQIPFNNTKKKSKFSLKKYLKR